MQKNEILKRVTLAVLAVSLLVAVVAGGSVYAKYVTDINFGGTVHIKADIGTITVYEHEAVKNEQTGEYALNTEKKANSNTYDLLPGLDIPKDPTVEVTKPSNIPVYVYLNVSSNITPSDKGLHYTMASCWLELAEGVYVYCDESTKEPIKLTAGATIPVLAEQKITVSQYLNQNVNGSAYLKFTAVMYQAVGDQTAAQIYDNNK